MVAVVREQIFVVLSLSTRALGKVLAPAKTPLYAVILHSAWKASFRTAIAGGETLAFVLSSKDDSAVLPTPSAPLFPLS